jgi:hypothetical protein
MASPSSAAHLILLTRVAFDRSHFPENSITYMHQKNFLYSWWILHHNMTRERPTDERRTGGAPWMTDMAWCARGEGKR